MVYFRFQIITKLYARGGLVLSYGTFSPTRLLNYCFVLVGNKIC